jgi:hypothetical protein
MASRRPVRPFSILEKDPDRDPSLVSAAPALELVPDGPVLPNLSSVKIRRDDKVEFDRLKAWWSVEAGRELSQWEAFTLLLAAAFESDATRIPRLRR